MDAEKIAFALAGNDAVVGAIGPAKPLTPKAQRSYFCPDKVRAETLCKAFSLAHRIRQRA
jgi:hypothetical protein